MIVVSAPSPGCSETHWPPWKKCSPYTEKQCRWQVYLVKEEWSRKKNEWWEKKCVWWKKKEAYVYRCAWQPSVESIVFSCNHFIWKLIKIHCSLFSLIINDSLDSGSQIPFIKRALVMGFGVIVLNTNQRVSPDADGNLAPVKVRI